MPLCKKCTKRDTAAKVGAAAGAAGAAGAAAAGAASAAGFSSSGIVGGSLAAAWQGAIGNVAAGSAFATLQSAGATGLIATVGVAGAGVAVVGGLAYFALRSKKGNDSESKRKEKESSKTPVCEECNEPLEADQVSK